ncbi:hypothetical protein Hanom_Chr04g00297001 [Helianthus anomalus]
MKLKQVDLKINLQTTAVKHNSSINQYHIIVLSLQVISKIYKNINIISLSFQLHIFLQI